MRTFSRPLLWSVITIVLSSPVLLAQTNGSRYVGTSVRVGLQFGGLLSGLNEQGGNPADRTGAIAGACVIFGFAPYLGNQFEVSLVSKGASDVSITTYPGPTYYHADELELRYLQFAFLGRLGGITMSPDKRSSVVPRVYAGPAAAFLLSEKWYGMDGPLDLDLEATDISLIIGAGADIRLGDRLQLTVDSRFDYGLREVAGSVKNRSSIFMVGLTY